VTRDELVTEIRRYAEGKDSARWSDTTTILPLLDQVFEAEWHEILQHAPHLQLTRSTIATNASSRVIVTGYNVHVLSITSADGEKRFAPSSILDEPLEATSTRADGRYRFWRENSSSPTEAWFFLSPATLSENVVVTFTSTPAPPSTVAGSTDISTIFPGRGEWILVMETAALLLDTGGSESSEATQLRRVAETLRAKLLDRLSRDSQSPKGWRFSDVPGHWGG